MLWPYFVLPPRPPMNDTALVCEEEGSPRRCGGQGDMLSGFTATFAHWAKLKLAEEGADKRGYVRCSMCVLSCLRCDYVGKPSPLVWCAVSPRATSPMARPCPREFCACC